MPGGGGRSAFRGKLTIAAPRNVRSLAPFGQSYALLGPISMDALHVVCVFAGAFGVGTMLVARAWSRR